MKQHAISLASGTIFGLGLAVSGMMDPKRVRGFLDILGDWDPTLAFVMGGAVSIMAFAWQFQRRMTKPFASTTFTLPDTRRIDLKLLSGASLFGIGWGLTGLCPGPAIASLSTSFFQAMIFVTSMLVGMAAFSAFNK